MRRFNPCPHCHKVAGYRKFKEIRSPHVSFCGWHDSAGDVWSHGWHILGMLSPHIVVMDPARLARYRRKRARARIDVCRNCFEAVT